MAAGPSPTALTVFRLAQWGAKAATLVFAVAACAPNTPAPSSVSSSSEASTSASTEASAPASIGPIDAPTAAPTVDMEDARAAFDAPATSGAFEVGSTATDDGVITRDITFISSGDREVQALLVTPEAEGTYPGVLFLHWYAPAEGGDRDEFLGEANELAKAGVVSLLPQQVFPWSIAPAGAEADRQAVVDQVTDLRAALDVLAALPEVDPEVLALVGHDFGGMYGTVLAGVDDRVDGIVAMAGVPYFADWYLRYWQAVPSGERNAYRTTMLAVDPVTFAAEIDVPTLLQFGESDQYVSRDAIETWREAFAATEPDVRTYPGGHRLLGDAIRADRRAFLDDVLGLQAE